MACRIMLRSRSSCTSRPRRAGHPLTRADTKAIGNTNLTRRFIRSPSGSLFFYTAIQHGIRKSPVNRASRLESYTQLLVSRLTGQRNSEFGTSGGFEFLTRELRSYIGMNGTNGGFACG